MYAVPRADRKEHDEGEKGAMKRRRSEKADSRIVQARGSPKFGVGCGGVGYLRRVALCIFAYYPGTGPHTMGPASLHVGFANFSVAATGFAWAENMVCVAARAALFVTENKRGELWRITWGGSRYNQTLMAGASADFQLLAGLAADDDGRLFALGNRHTSEDGGKCVLVEVNTSDACTASCAAPYRVVAALSRACLGDGLALDASHFYSANEGDFVPLRGRVVRISRSGSAAVEALVDHGFADDGVALDSQRGLLYVSEVWSPTHTPSYRQTSFRIDLHAGQNKSDWS